MNISTSRAYENATEPPTMATENASTAEVIGGAVLLVGVKREVLKHVRVALQELGYTTFATQSEVLALELLEHGEIFDAVIVQAAVTRRDSPLAAQFGLRCRRIPLLMVPKDFATFESEGNSSSDAEMVIEQGNRLSRRIDELITEKRHSESRESGVIPTGATISIRCAY